MKEKKYSNDIASKLQWNEFFRHKLVSKIVDTVNVQHKFVKNMSSVVVVMYTENIFICHWRHTLRKLFILDKRK